MLRGIFGGAEKRILSLETVQNRPGVDVSIWMFCGEEEPWLMPAEPSEGNATGFTIAMWLRLNGMEAQIPKD